MVIDNLETMNVVKLVIGVVAAMVIELEQMQKEAIVLQ